MRSYKRVSRLFVFSVMLSVIAVLGVLFFCLNVLFDVSLFRFAVLRAAARRLLFCGLGVLIFCIDVLFDVHLFVLRAEVRSLLVLLFWRSRLSIAACRSAAAANETEVDYPFCFDRRAFLAAVTLSRLRKFV